jgi:uncharacterized membrane protein
MEDDQIQARVPWQAIATLILCAIGLAISLYTLWVHYEPSALVCANAGPVDCAAVLTSTQSVVFGIPVPFFGLAFFIVCGATCLPAAWRTQTIWVHWLRITVAVVGMLTVLYLISVELFTIKKICLWCTGVHFVTFLLFAVILINTPKLMTSNHDNELTSRE